MSACLNELAPAMATLDRRVERPLELVKLAKCGLKSQAMLILFEMADAKEAFERAGYRHGLDLARKRRKPNDRIIGVNSLLYALAEISANGCAGSQSAIKLFVRARLVSADANQIF